MAELTDEQIKLEAEFLKGVPRVNIGALFMPSIWGPAHGMWATVLFYPLWLLADNTLYAAWTERSVLAIIFAVLLLASLVIATVVFSILSQPFAAHRAASRGIGKAEYLRRERIWALVCPALAISVVALATYYNLVVRPGLGGM